MPTPTTGAAYACGQAGLFVVFDNNFLYMEN